MRPLTGSNDYEDFNPDDGANDALNALAERLRQREVELRSGVSRILSRKQVEQAFLETFELVGGVPRMALWANEEKNYGAFLQMLTKILPKEAVQGEMARVIEYRSNVPASPLNRPPVVLENMPDE